MVKRIATEFKIICIILWMSFCCNRWASGTKVRIVELTNGWTLKNQNRTIEVPVGKIPSGVYTALNDIYGDLLHSYNDVNLRWIAYDNWTYEKNFSVDREDFKDIRFVNLTLHGVDTVAEVRLNDVSIGYLDNMFVRYSFAVLPYLRSENHLEVVLTSPIFAAKNRARALELANISTPSICPEAAINGECHRNLLRKLQSSFGDDSNPAAPSMGIWKPITLEYYEAAVMRDVDVATFRNDSHWMMDLRVFLSPGMKQDFFTELTVLAPNLLEKPVSVGKRLVSYSSPVINLTLEIPINKVDLWWPNGYGNQKLYPLYISANCWLEAPSPRLRFKTRSDKSLMIGFRTVELIENEVENGRNFFFKVNDVEMFMKGAVYIPAHILPELSVSPDRVRHLLKSAQEAHFNMIRVWGGGFYESDDFYNLTDQFGLLVWQDMPFTSAIYPLTDDFIQSVRMETIQNAQRLSHHPSLLLFVGNNEIELDLLQNKHNTEEEYERFWHEYRQLFVGTIKKGLNVIARGSYQPRPGPMRSTPSNGVHEERNELSSNPQNPYFGDVHIQEDSDYGWDADAYPRARFISKYGYRSLPITPSWLRTLARKDNLIELMKHRDHNPEAWLAVEALMVQHLPLPGPEEDHYEAALIYFSQISQAMAMKAATEMFRSQRGNTETKTMGALYWQLNDVWVAPTCSSIDYYGNYKLLYYWSKEFLAPTAIIALYDSSNRAINVTLVRDEINVAPEVFDVTVNVFLWSQVHAKTTIRWQAVLREGETQLKILPLDSILGEPAGVFTVRNCFIEFMLGVDGHAISRTFVFPHNILETVGISDPELNISWKHCYEDTSSHSRINIYTLTIRIRRPALFVYIEVQHPTIERYKLSNNGFVQVESVKTVHLEFVHPTDCLSLRAEHISVQTVNQYLKSRTTKQ